MPSVILSASNNFRWKVSTPRGPGALLLLLVTATAPRGVRAQAPVPILTEVQPPAVRVGEVTRIELRGKNLEGATALLFDASGLEATAVPPAPPPSPERGKDRKGNDPVPSLWEVTAGAGVTPGLHEVRVVSPLGLSAPRMIHVAGSPVVALDPEKGEVLPLELETRAAGQLEEGLVDRFRLRVEKPGAVVVECLAERIDSRADATLEVRESSSARRVGFSRDALGSDPLVAFEASADTDYLVEVWDFNYRGKFPYLLLATREPRPLFAFPPAVSPGAKARVTIHGWCLPGGSPLPGAEGALQSLRREVSPAPVLAGESSGIWWSTAGHFRGALYARPFATAEPLLLVEAAGPVGEEVEPNNSPASAVSLSVPGTVCGRFGAPRDVDWFRVTVRKGTALELEVVSARLGAPCDPVLLVARRREKGGKETIEDVLYLDERKSGFPREDNLGRKFVAPDRDPVALWTPPDDGEFLLQLRNRNGKSGPQAVYALGVRPAAAGFSLVAIHGENLSGEAPTVPAGGAQALDLLVERTGGFEGSIEVTAEGLPPGVTCRPVYLGPRDTRVPLILAAAPEAKPWTGAIRIAGRAEWRGAELTQAALGAVTVYGGSETKHPLQYTQSRFTTSIPIAVRGAAPFGVELVPAELAVVPGSRVKLVAKVTRGTGFAGPVQLAFQGLGEKSEADDNGVRPTRVTVEKDRVEAPLEIEVKGDSPRGVSSFAVYATAQVDYPDRPLDPSSKLQKRRTTYVSTPVTVHVVPPWELSLGQVPTGLARGGSFPLAIELRRAPDVEAEVEVSLDLPGGIRGIKATPVKLGKGETSGTLVVELGSEAPGGRVEGLRVRSRGQVGGRGFDEKTPLQPFEVESAFQIDGPLTQARLGALRLGLRLRTTPSGDRLRARIRLTGEGGFELATETFLEKGQLRLGALFDTSRLPPGVGLPKGLRAQVTLATKQGELVEEHAVNPLEGGIK